MPPWKDDPAGVRPMLAAIADAALDDPALAYEPKYDGIRALAAVDAGGVRLWSRLGNEKTAQFPEVVATLARFGARLERPVLLDGEIVALDADGRPQGFQQLQRRHHKTSGTAADSALIVFDLLRDGAEDLRPLALRDRRTRLERLLDGATDGRLRLSEQVTGAAGREMYERARAHGWEGLLAKRLASPYQSGRRSTDWKKLKLVRHQTAVVGGWTEPRGTRPFFGALVLGVYDDRRRLHYIGHAGAGFSDAELGRLWKQLRALASKECPFTVVPKSQERPHWVRPKLVAEVKFTEWTADSKLRHPTYLGLRDDIRAESVRREPDPPGVAAATSPSAPAQATARPTAGVTRAVVNRLLQQIDQIEGGTGNGVLQLPGGRTLPVSNLGKLFYPALGLTKGDLFRHYVRVAPLILPVLAGRPLVMKRYPNGVTGKPFYQHRAAGNLPAGVEVGTVTTGTDERPHLIGGSLVTLLYTVQLAAISQDPWFSRIGSDEQADHAAIDLDPPEGLPFRAVLDVARWLKDELDSLRCASYPKTSGAGGLHIYVPMPAGTPYEAGQIFCQIVATRVARKHPRAATLERSIAARGRRVYLDCLQNTRGKTLASAYSARANDFAGVSAPVTWEEVDGGVSPRDFTLPTFAARLQAVGDLWAGLRRGRTADLHAVATPEEQA